MTNILKLARRARQAALPVTMSAPAPRIPDTQTILGVPLEPQMASLYRLTNGCRIGELSVYGAVQVPWDIIRNNRSMRESYDYIPFLHDVLACARASLSLHDLVAVPAHADDHGHQPIVLLDANEAPFIMPLASTLNRAFELVVTDEIGASQDEDWHDDGFPYSVAHFVASDVRLMELVRAGAFDNVGGGVDIEAEWHELLRELAPE